MSNSVQPHGLQATRLLCPWDSPGKNTGVGCHFLLQCMKVESESEVVQSCPTLSDPMDCSLSGSSIHGMFQATVMEWGAIAFSHIYSQACRNHWLLATFGMPMPTHPYQAPEERNHLPQEVRVRNKELTSSTNQDSAEVNKRSARDGRLQSRGPSNFQRAAKTQHSQNEFNVTKNK